MFPFLVGGVIVGIDEMKGCIDPEGAGSEFLLQFALWLATNGIEKMVVGTDSVNAFRGLGG